MGEGGLDSLVRIGWGGGGRVGAGAGGVRQMGWWDGGTMGRWDGGWGVVRRIWGLVWDFLVEGGVVGWWYWVVVWGHLDGVREHGIATGTWCCGIWCSCSEDEIGGIGRPKDEFLGDAYVLLRGRMLGWGWALSVTLVMWKIFRFEANWGLLNEFTACKVLGKIYLVLCLENVAAE